MSGKNVIYQASLQTQNQKTFKYVGLTEKPFIERYSQHQSSFRVHDPRNFTTLSKKVLEIQRKHTLFEIEWIILEVSKSYTPGAEDCRLCLAEIYHILFFPAEASLNSRQEFLSKCRHKNKYQLINSK